VLDTQGPGNSDPLILNQNWEKMPEYRSIPNIMEMKSLLG
jgi:hypothetical protein